MSLFVTDISIFFVPGEGGKPTPIVDYTIYDTEKGTVSKMLEDTLKSTLYKKKADVVNAQLVLRKDAPYNIGMYDLKRYEIKGKTGSFDRFFKEYNEYKKRHKEFLYKASEVPEYYTIINYFMKRGEKYFTVVRPNHSTREVENIVTVLNSEQVADLIKRGMVVNAKLSWYDKMHIPVISGINWSIPMKKENDKATISKDKTNKTVKDLIRLRNVKSFEMAMAIDEAILDIVSDSSFKDFRYTITVENDTEKNREGDFDYSIYNAVLGSYARVRITIDKDVTKFCDELTIFLIYDFSIDSYNLNFVPNHYNMVEVKDFAQVLDILVGSVRDFYFNK